MAKMMMTSVKLKFRPSSASDAEGTLSYQIIHRRIVRNVLSPYRIYPEEWDSDTSAIRLTSGCSRREHLLLIRDKVDWEIRQLYVFINRMERDGLDFNADDVVRVYRESPHAQSVFSFFLLQINRLRQQQKIKTSENYHATFRKFSAFVNHHDISFEAIDKVLIQRFETYLSNEGLIRNTTSFHMRILRAVYNLAVEDNLTVDRHIFHHVYTGVDTTVKRALPLSAIKQIKKLDLSDTPDIDFARDIFMFSFYTRGMSFVDIAFLRKSDLRQGSVSYCRKKTHRRLTFRWEHQMEEIVCKHPNKDMPYMLPIIDNPDADEHKQYINRLCNINSKLKIIAKKIGLDMPLTLYVARHSWASIAKANNIPISVISEGMGHNSELTTRIYLTTLDSTEVDTANKIILDDL